MKRRLVCLAVLVPAEALLNLLYVWTSGVITEVPLLAPAGHAVDDLFLGGTFKSLAEFDLLPLGLLVAIVVAGFAFEYSGRVLTALFKTVLVAALTLLPLPVEVYLFDSLSKGAAYSADQFYLPVTAAQAAYGILPWFTNADLLVSSIALASVASAALLVTARGSASKVG